MTRSVLVFICLFYLGACAIKPPLKPSIDTTAHAIHLKQIAHITQFHLQGRLAVNADGKGYSGSMIWQHLTDADTIDVLSPLGSKIAHIEKTHAQVTLTNAKGEQIRAEDAESLTEKTLGWRLPLIGLNDWALGRPTQAPISAQTWDDTGKLTTLVQQGWKIEYLAYQDHMGMSLPQKISLRRDNILLKLVVEQWTTGI